MPGNATPHNRDPRIDAYIAEAAEWARPILIHLRELTNATVPEATETIKWGVPYWEYHGLLCGLAVFKAHAAFVLTHENEIPEVKALYGESQKAGMGVLGKITRLDDLPADSVIAHAIRLVADFNIERKSSPAKATARSVPAALPVPDDLSMALAENAEAARTFEGLPPGKRNDYVVWLTDAKTAATRAKRLATAIEWLAEGKSRMWKYERK
jgi:hypothetical protein